MTNSTTTPPTNSRSSVKVFKINTILVSNVDGQTSDATVSYHDGSTSFLLALFQMPKR